MKSCIIFSLCALLVLSACNRKPNKTGKGIDYRSTSFKVKKVDGIDAYTTLPDSLIRPGTVMLTQNDSHRLIPVFKLNYNKRSKSYFTGSNGYHYSYFNESQFGVNNWNGNYLPGFEAMYGYNLINVAHYNLTDNKQTYLLKQPGLVNTVYYPANTMDTLNGKIVKRDFYMLSVYDKDTNEDSIINKIDLRHLYQFDNDGNNQNLVIPENYSVTSSKYDYMNDILYVYARLDVNENGIIDNADPTEVFYLKLTYPVEAIKMFEN